MRKRVVITGLGCVSPLGNDVASLWGNILAGKSGVGMITHYDTSPFEVKIGAEVKDFDGVSLFGAREARRMDRFAQFGLAAAIKAMHNSGLVITESNRDHIGVVLGTGIGGMNTLFEQMEVFFKRGPDRVSPFLVPMMLPDTAAGMIAIHLGVRGPNMAVVSACASSTNALGEAAEMIRRGSAEVIISGGAESMIVQIAMAGFGVMSAFSARYD